MDIPGLKGGSRCGSSKTACWVSLSIKSQARLDEIAMVENLPKNTIIEKLIMNYVPIPAPKIPGEFRSMYMANIRRLLRTKPHAVITSLYPNGKIGVPVKLYMEKRDGVISIKEFQRKYIERLMLPDAQAEILRLRKLRETNVVYVGSFEGEEEGSMRQIFVDFVNGKLTWK